MSFDMQPWIQVLYVLYSSGRGIIKNNSVDDQMYKIKIMEERVLIHALLAITQDSKAFKVFFLKLIFSNPKSN